MTAMPKPERQENVLKLLNGLRGIEPLKQLFWSELNYQRVNQPLSRRGWTDTASNALADDPVLFATGGEDNAFHILYCRLASNKFLRGLQRPVVNRLVSEHPYALFVFSDSSQQSWHFINLKYDANAGNRRLIRRISATPGAGLRTASERLQMLDLSTIGGDLFGLSPMAIQARCDEAFDVEAVTKEFYREIANWYFWARNHALFPKDAPDADRKPSLSLIRLITRLIFCWFLREKTNPATGEGLLPDVLFDPPRIPELLKDSSAEACTYYTAILQNLFFATLNTEMDRPGQAVNRRFVDEGDGQRSDDHMVHTVWRHYRQLQDPESLAQLLRRVPFLNGGLFECLDDRVQRGNSPYAVEVRIDGFASDPKKQPKLPNFLFFGRDQVANLSEAYGDPSRTRETVRPFLSILRRYNFTLTENTPLEQEVALDPELLGHVFENLLAAYNPETGTVARKATGSFYTPRVVVDWMVDQALTVYFRAVLEKEETFTSRNGTEKRLQHLLSWEELDHEFSPKEVEKLIDAIDHMKALDPACGSGAFPMGLLHKLVHVLKKLDPDNRGWRRRQERTAEAMESSTAREETQKAIERAFAHDNDDYGRKLFLIENCLYGVDIQPIACQIAKLRFFISLIVDQTIDPKESNYGILPLPNLETRIVAADTLMGLYRGQLLLGSDKVRRLEEALQQVRHDYFTARSYKGKKELKARDRQLCAELASALTESGECTPYDSKRLAEWNPYDTNAFASFFHPGWMFGLTSPNSSGVFDVVIGNPPYVRQEELKNRNVIGSDGRPRPLKDFLKDQYDCYTGTADLYVYFFERSLQLLRTGRVLSFITSNKYLRAAYGERLRTYLAQATRPWVVLDFGDTPLFTSIAYPCILVTEKVRNIELGQLPKTFRADHLPKEWQSRVLTWSTGRELHEFPDIFEAQAHTLAQQDLKNEGWRLESPVKLRLLERLQRAGTPLSEYVKNRFYYGIKTGLNEAFVVNRATRDRLIAEHPSSKEILQPFLRGRDVKRWRCEFAEQYLIRIESSENKQHPWSGEMEKEAEKRFAKFYPAIYNFIQPMRRQLIERYDQGKYFWELRSCDYWHEFEKPKVVVPAIEDEVNYAPDLTGFCGNDKTSIIIPPSVPFALAIVNSAVSWWITRQKFASRQGGFFEFKPMYVSTLPMPFSSPDQQSVCERLALK